MKSIRTTLTLWLLGGIGVAAVAASIVLYVQVRATIVEQFDAALAAKVRALGSQLDIDGKHIEFAYVPGLMPEFEGGDWPEYFQMSTMDGNVLERSDTLVNAQLPVRFGETDAPASFDLALPDGRAGRAVGIVIVVEAGRSNDGPKIVIVAARGREPLDAALAAVRAALAIACGLLLIAGAIIVAVTVRRGLRPLVQLGREVERIDPARLDTRVTRDGMPIELRPTADKLNELLDRVAEAFARERRVTGNIAHELRTPIAELRTAVDVARRWPEDEALREAAIETAHAVSARMAELVVGLLRLARFAAGSANLDLQDVDLRELFDTSWHAVERSAKERRVRLDQHTPSGVVVRTDRSLLSIVVANLLDNAVRFAEPDSAITCAVDHVADASSVTWTIKNRTSALETGDLARLTEPFWQKSAARTESDHAGLGLTLVNAAAQAIGAELRFRLYDEFCVDVTMRSAH